MAACEARGGRLAVLDTAQKQAEASAIRPSSWAGWVAAVAPAGDGVWGWHYGNEWSYENWGAQRALPPGDAPLRHLLDECVVVRVRVTLDP